MEAAMSLTQSSAHAQEAERDGDAGLHPRLLRAPSAPAHAMPPSRDVVRVFDADPDLLRGLDPAAVEFLRRRVLTPKLWVETGAWTPASGQTPPFGLLVVDGLIIRSVRLNGRNCPELLGAGDVLRPWDQDLDVSAPGAVTWRAVEASTIAILDEHFVRAVCRWPTIMSELLSRTVQRSRTLAVHLAIVHVRQAPVRLRMLLWHLGDRWGRVTPEGVHLPLALTHETLGDLACMRRPTASTALRRLCDAGELERNPDGTWLLKGDPPTSDA